MEALRGSDSQVENTPGTIFDIELATTHICMLN